MKVRQIALAFFCVACVTVGLILFLPQTVTFHGHSARVSSVVCSPDGKTLASVSEDQAIKLWDVTSRQAKVTLQEPAGHVCSMAFSPDGRTLASAAYPENVILLWDLDSGAAATLRGHADHVKSVAFSPDGKILASASCDKTVKLWDVVSRKERVTLRANSGWGRCVAFSPDGKTLAAGGNSMTVKLWDVKSGTEQARLQGFAISRGFQVIISLAFSPDGKTLASGDTDGRVNLWDVAGAKKLVSLGVLNDEANDGSYVECVVFSPDGKTLAATDSEAIGIWDIGSCKKTATYQYKGRPHPLNSLLDRLNGPLHSLSAYFPDARDDVSSINFRADGKLIAFGMDDTTVKMWEVAGIGALIPH
jgi:WD40 repeat protein